MNKLPNLKLMRSFNKDYQVFKIFKAFNNLKMSKSSLKQKIAFIQKTVRRQKHVRSKLKPKPLVQYQKKQMKPNNKKTLEFVIMHMKVTKLKSS